MAKKEFNSQSNIEKELWAMAEPLAASFDCELVDVEYVKEAGQWYVRFMIDREIPIDHEICGKVSEALSAALDEKDPIPYSYMLEVSSPGIERPLRKESDFLRFAGKEAVINLYAPIEGKKAYQGILAGLHVGAVLLLVNGREMTFPFDQIAKARLSGDI